MTTKYRSAHFVISSLMLLAVSATAQDYYPLKVGNAWFYRYDHPPYPNPSDPTVDTIAVHVVADTLVVNGKVYYTLSEADAAGGRFLRSDSEGVYYYDTIGQVERHVFRTSVSEGDTNQVWWGWYTEIVLTKIDTMTVFGVQSRVLHFLTDGLLRFEISLAEKFGPTKALNYGDPPGIFPLFVHQLAGCALDSLKIGYTTSVASLSVEPMVISLHQNFPNPFNSMTRINFTVHQASDYDLKITNMVGQVVWKSSGHAQPRQLQSVLWDGTDEHGQAVPSGVYFMLLLTSDMRNSRKLLLLR